MLFSNNVQKKVDGYFHSVQEIHHVSNKLVINFLYKNISSKRCYF